MQSFSLIYVLFHHWFFHALLVRYKVRHTLQFIPTFKSKLYIVMSIYRGENLKKKTRKKLFFLGRFFGRERVFFLFFLFFFLDRFLAFFLVFFYKFPPLHSLTCTVRKALDPTENEDNKTFGTFV